MLYSNSIQILKERGIDKTVQDLALESLEKHGYTDFNSKCLLQCFEYQVILDLQSRTNVKRLFLTNRLEVAENPEILQKLQEAQVAVICVNKDMLVPTDSAGHCRQQANEGLVTKVILTFFVFQIFKGCLKKTNVIFHLQIWWLKIHQKSII